MAITTVMCSSYKKEVLEGVHAAADTYKIALYTSATTLNAATTDYGTPTDEVASGGGYTTGGATLTGFAATLDGTTGIIDFDDATWPAATITARGALIYNSSKSNKAVACFDFGADITSTGGTFTVPMPVAVAATAVVRIA